MFLRKYKAFILTILIGFPLISSRLVAEKSEFDKHALLKYIADTTSDQTELPYVYYDISNSYYDVNFDSCLVYAKISLKLAEDLQDTTAIINAHDILGYSFDVLNHSEQSLTHFNKALELSSALQDSSYMAHCYHNIGYVISHSHDQAKSLEFFLKSLVIAEQIQDTSGLSDVYNNVGTFYEFTKNLESAKHYYSKSVTYERLEKDTSNLVSSLANLAHINVRLKRIDEAKIYYDEAESLLPYIRDHYSLGLAYSIFIDYFLELKNEESAQHFINLIDLLAQRDNNKMLKAEVSKQKGDLSYLRGLYKTALSHYDKSLSIFREINTPEQYATLYRQKSKTFAKLKHYKKAHEALEISNQFDDSLKVEDVARLLGEFEQNRKNQIEVTNKQLALALKQKNSENLYFKTRANLQITLIALIFFIITSSVSILVYFIIRKRNITLNQQKQTIEKNKILLEKHIKALKKSEKDLREMNLTKDKFFSIIAHDLKNPFNTLLGFSDLLKNDITLRSSDDFDQIAVSMYNSASFGYQLLENLLDWSQSQTNQIKHQPEDITLEEVLHRNISLFKETAKTKNIKIRLVHTETHNVYADRNMLNTIIRNLLSNAIKFSYQQSEIQVSITTENQEVVTSFVDSGTGISNTDQSKLFKLDEDVQYPGTDNERGTGLGLILCKEFVERNKGRIWLKSKLNEGSTISFSLPRHQRGVKMNRKPLKVERETISA